MPELVPVQTGVPFALRSAVLKGELMHADTRQGKARRKSGDTSGHGPRASTRSPPAELSEAEIADVFRTQLSRWRANTKRLKLRIDPQT